ERLLLKSLDLIDLQAKLCVSENILVVSIPGPCALVSALSTASGLPTNEFTFVPPYKLSQFLEEASSMFGDARKIFLPQFWRGIVGEAKEVFFMRKPKGELTMLIEGQTSSKAEPSSNNELEDELRESIASGKSLPTVIASFY
ncbi:hypothetical protein PIB30_085510, partial [Stylosanthes scabra]|nr:hypothetical protein [Stylosanthes scabra]